MRLSIGIDIAEKRGCAIAAMSEDGRSAGTRWTTSDVSGIVAAVRDLASGHDSVVGIDAPRMPVHGHRAWYWAARTASWRRRTPEDKGWGRHCEVVVSSLGLANPQWTPPVDLAKPWMLLGFDLFAALEGVGRVHEVFPSASYSQLARSPEPTFQLSFAGFAAGPKDMLDAYVAAVTVLEYERNRGAAVGDGDGLGSIVLPRPVASTPAALFAWPGSRAV